MKKLIGIIKYLLILSIGVGLLYLAFKGQNLEEMIHELKNAKYEWVLLSVIIVFIAHISRAARWNILIKPLGYTPKLLNTTAAVLVAYITNLVFPRLGEVARCGALKKTDKIPMDKLIGTVVVERGIDFIALLGILFISVLLQVDLVSAFFMETVINPFTNKLVDTSSNLKQIMIIGGIIFVLLVVTLFYLRNKIKDLEAYKKLITLIAGFIQGIKTIKHMENKPLFVFHTFFIWGSYFLMTWVCFNALDATGNLGIPAAMFIFAMGGVGMAAPVQGGIGTFHWAVAQSMVLYGIAESDGLVFATLIHAGHTIFTLIFGGASLIYVLILEKKTNLQAASEPA